MEKVILYMLIIFFSNTIGAISGMGGGVIIKPILDALSSDSLVAINFYSSFAVFIMSIVSTIKSTRKSVKVSWKETIYLSIGSLIGGKFGDLIFMYLKNKYQNEGMLNLIQIIIVVISLITALVFSKKSNFVFNKNIYSSLFVISGIFLGTLSTFLGIGGGPINVALLIFLFNFDVKKATAYSIVSIFFSQLMKLISSSSILKTSIVNLSILPWIAIAAILGGYIGSTISTKISDKSVLTLYKTIVVFVIGLNIFNGLTLLI